MEECLYDLEHDPFERLNLVREPEWAPVRQHLAARLTQLMIEAGEPMPKIVPARA